MIRIGLDVGSTTLKCIVLSETGEILFKKYERHFSQIADKAADMLSEIHSGFPTERDVRLCISGSAGMGFAEQGGIPFMQEVYATRVAIRELMPSTDVVIELGGEDAKILFLSDTIEVRMNGSCAGGTGAFIDQMATLLNVTPDELNELSKSCEKTYSIASRCGVFAKSDIQPLLNQGARKEDISASILASVVNQTIAGLAQGREIEGNIVYLGGPLTFLSELRHAFDKALSFNGVCKGVCPENSLYYVAFGAALQGGEGTMDICAILERIRTFSTLGGYICCSPLFKSGDEYEQFIARHNSKRAPLCDSFGESNLAYVGIDAGSTTVKAVALNSAEEVVFSRYLPNSGNPVPIVLDFFKELYERYPEVRIAASASTGYGEEIIKQAFHADFGIVETIAHYCAAKKYEPLVDFIIDIGGQDIKCFKVRNSAIDNIFLNEACSSGCGSFLQTFAGALGYSVMDFAKLGLFADRPVDLGSRCTVFMNSSVKQAQKDGASVENISAGLSISVVKNALYKVIRATSKDALGEHIVVQGGTFLNDAVLRAFELEIGRDVTRPAQAELMGALGAALYAKEHIGNKKSKTLSAERLSSFTHTVTATTCKGCTNGCRLTVNVFDDGRRFIGGNQCDRPLGNTALSTVYNLYDYKRTLLKEYGEFSGERGTVGIPMGLNMFELLPFWHAFFKSLNIGVKLSGQSSKSLYYDGQGSIPSDTVCYPAKLMHGHIESLIKAGVQKVFYPCLTYNFDEGLGDNHYNCPVVAYYPEVIAGNMKSVKDISLIKDYVGIHRPKDFPKKMHVILEREFGKIPLPEVKAAAKAAYAEYGSYMERVRNKGNEYLSYAQANDLPVIILCGRPYHLDEEINHGIDRYICSQGAVLISEDALGDKFAHRPTMVLNQWTYHSRLYAAARFIAESNSGKINLVQLVSFGCGLDAITTDEVRMILENDGHIYTQIKIDEITNLGAVKIRLRSLFAATYGEGGMES